MIEHWRGLIARQARGLAAGWVFPSSTGEIRYTATLHKPLKRSCEAVGIERRFTPHGFRRTFNNLLRQVTTGTVQRAITGHSTERMSEHYSHVPVDEKRRATLSALELVFPKSADSGADSDDGNENAGRSGHS